MRGRIDQRDTDESFEDRSRGSSSSNPNLHTLKNGERKSKKMGVGWCGMPWEGLLPESLERVCASSGDGRKSQERSTVSSLSGELLRSVLRSRFLHLRLPPFEYSGTQALRPSGLNGLVGRIIDYQVMPVIHSGVIGQLPDIDKPGLSRTVLYGIMSQRIHR
ncbi:hypothetical protein BDW42DRAFT_148815 [Aspergillus taichungensis]|uniref:Uncharacterized protein n=1 Tax=Aspergillus taichungensis TaxID=482145 RepID=A0A2J5HLY5_9EURO|nr:hypothetical protein BDW42DRAFT_148815 [Aspergillus taichungensis]